MLHRRLSAGAAVVGLVTQMACYSYLPPQDAIPVVGTNVAVELNDRGRVLAGGQLGEAVMTVQGRLVGATDSSLTLSVARTVMLQGSSSVWTGENVAIPRAGVRGIRIRQASRGRSVALAAALVAGVFLIGSAITLIGGGNKKIPGGGCEPPGCDPT